MKIKSFKMKKNKDQIFQEKVHYSQMSKRKKHVFLKKIASYISHDFLMSPKSFGCDKTTEVIN